MSFRLASLLRVRRLQADAAAASAASAAARARAAQGTVAQRRADLTGAAAPHTADEWQFRSAVAARSSRSSLLTESVADADRQEAGAARAREGWTAARRAVRGLDLLEEHAGRAAGGDAATGPAGEARP